MIIDMLIIIQQCQDHTGLMNHLHYTLSFNYIASVIVTTNSTLILLPINEVTLLHQNVRYDIYAISFHAKDPTNLCVSNQPGVIILLFHLLQSGQH